MSAAKAKAVDHGRTHDYLESVSIISLALQLYCVLNIYPLSCSEENEDSDDGREQGQPGHGTYARPREGILKQIIPSQGREVDIMQERE